MITQEEIRLIPRRYAIGKRPLSLLLGWGELTYTRLLDGNKPSPAHAQELRLLFDDPAVYARILETGRGRITEAAYTRSRKAVDSLLEHEGGANAAKIFEVADRLCLLANGDLTPLALQKLVYCSQGLGFARLDSALFDELPVASATGPLYMRLAETYTYDEIRRAGSAGTFPHPNNANKAEFSYTAPKSLTLTDKELSVVDEAYRLFGIYSGSELSRITCESAPWKKARKRAGASQGEDCAECITAKSMRKYFSKL